MKPRVPKKSVVATVVGLYFCIEEEAQAAGFTRFASCRQ